MQSVLHRLRPSKWLLFGLFVGFVPIVSIALMTLYLTGSYALIAAGNAGQIIWAILNAAVIAFGLLWLTKKPKAPK